jgi:2-amino-4-hydroxy-6-hydroxymethyldihydropteridine diphosphokinase
VTAAVALGSNLGDRESHLAWARVRLAEILTDLKVSTVHQTAPIGVVGSQRHFLNQVVVGATELTARHLLDKLLAFENERGRQRPFYAAPRTLDLDLILFGQLILNENGLAVPHARFRERLFVLEPLAEIAPGMIDPVTGKSVSELLAALAVASSGRRL